MKTNRIPFRNTPLAALLMAGLLAGAVLSGTVEAQNTNRTPSRAQMVEALRLDGGPVANGAGKVRRTRGLAITSQGAEEGSAAEAAPAENANSIELASAAEPRPQRAAAQSRAIDLDIQFEFDSDRLTNDGRDLLDQLGEALQDEALASIRTITIEGHTDSIGNAGYNRLLSVRRANAAKTYLVRQHQIAGSKLRSVGKGSSEPVEGVPTTDPSNRRVRIVVQG